MPRTAVEGNNRMSLRIGADQKALLLRAVALERIATAAGSTAYIVTFTSDEDKVWSVHAAPALGGETPEPMPGSFSGPTH